MERKYNENIQVYSQREIVPIDKSNFTLLIFIIDLVPIDGFLVSYDMVLQLIMDKQCLKNPIRQVCQFFKGNYMYM